MRRAPGSAKASPVAGGWNYVLKAGWESGRWRERAAGRGFQVEDTAPSVESEAEEWPEGSRWGGRGGQGGKVLPALLRSLDLFLRVVGATEGS